MQASIHTGTQEVGVSEAGHGPVHTGSANLQNEVTEDFISERRLWTAVLAKAIDDWRNGTLRARREAQKFLFEDTPDFSEVCAGAGIDPTSFRAKLQKMGSRISMSGPWLGSLVAQS